MRKLRLLVVLVILPVVLAACGNGTEPYDYQPDTLYYEDLDDTPENGDTQPNAHFFGGLGLSALYARKQFRVI